MDVDEQERALEQRYYERFKSLAPSFYDLAALMNFIARNIESEHELRDFDRQARTAFFDRTIRLHAALAEMNAKISDIYPSLRRRGTEPPDSA